MLLGKGTEWADLSSLEENIGCSNARLDQSIIALDALYKNPLAVESAYC